MIELTFTTDTAIYAAGDVIADFQQLLTAQGRQLLLQSLHLLDESDQGVELTLIFSTAATTLGTENAAPSIADADARNIFAAVKIDAVDYTDIGGSRIATKTNLGIIFPNETIYVAILNSTGTPTYGATALRGKFFTTLLT